MPAELKSYNPWEDCRFSLQMKKGRLVRDVGAQALIHTIYTIE
jgi:hypothetical protein